ncbi:hypothetical protein QBC44DRAFT_385726 [Cladorrhinum sp. PSN332]|nr:hypothetical protein QBC44DRAFT_385726 [Cladorrhinum sp. PSN332]
MSPQTRPPASSNQGAVVPPGSNSSRPTVNVSFRIISLAASEASNAVSSTPASETTPKSGSNATEKQQPPVKNQPLKAILLTTLNIQAPNVGILRNEATLAHLRSRIKQAFPTISPFAFCNEDGAVAPDHINLNQYFGGFRKPPTIEETTVNVYVTSTAPRDASQNIASVLSKPFLLKFLRVVDSKNSNIEGSVDSSSVFKGKNAAATTLSILRQLVSSMSVAAQQDTFCLPDGTPVPDNIPLERYLVMAKPAINDKEKVPSIPVFLKKTGLVATQPTNNFRDGSGMTGGGHGGLGSNTNGLGGGGNGTLDPDVMAKLGKMDLSFTDRSAHELKLDKSKLQVTEMLAGNYAASGGGTATHANKLNEADWDLILRNSNALHGWIFDFEGNRIVRAPHAAFKLRRGLNLEKVVVKVEKPAPEEDKPSNTDVPANSPDNEHEISSSQGNDAQAKPKPAEKKTPPPLKEGDIKEFVPRKPHGIPSFSVTDDCHIEVAAVQHEFAHSMAENHFDRTSFEFEAAGVIKGVSLGAQAGASTENENGRTSSNKSITKTLIATYRVPRVTIYLPPEDLEVTDEFAAAIANIRKTKNLYDLRKLHRSFGQIFCSEITLGGCLQTVKTLTATETTDETMTRNKFKGTVGLAVGVPQVFSASAKLSRETQDQTAQATREFSQKENISFNATGGNTILAADPASWLTSVGSDFNSWRVIRQLGIKPVMDVVSEIPGYDEIKMWFLQAVPKLNEYVVIPQSRTLDVRFKVLFNLEGLSRALAALEVGRKGDKQVSKNEDVGLSKSSKSGVNIQTYLAHNPSKPPVHVRTFVKQLEHAPEISRSGVRFQGGSPIVDVTTKIYQTTDKSDYAIFQPVSTQAPVLLDPRALPQDPAKDGSKSPFVDSRTVWRLEVPYGYSLTHDSLVTIRSQAPTNPGQTLTLTIYRNAQGVFMPAITDNPDPIYWRVLKADANSTKEAGKLNGDAKQIKFGDAIRLCFSFNDQASGWRDYHDDFYGRHRFDRPSEVTNLSRAGTPSEKEDVRLYLKAPFPRFEALDDPQGMSLLLSPHSTRDPVLEMLPLRADPKGPDPSKLDEVAYNLFDLTFRLDFVTQVGPGGDYMNVSTRTQDDTASTVRELLREAKHEEHQSAGDMVERVGNHIVGKYTKQFDNLGNAIASGSPGDVALNILKTGAMLSPIGAITNLLGLW